MESSTIAFYERFGEHIEQLEDNSEDRDANPLRVAPLGDDEECPSKNCWTKVQINGKTFCQLSNSADCANIQCSESGLDAFISYDVMGLQYRKGGGSLKQRFGRGKKWLQVGDENKEECLVKLDIEASGFYLSVGHAACGGKLTSSKKNFLTIQHSLRYPFNDAVRRRFGDKKEVNSIDLVCNYPRKFNISSAVLVENSFHPGLESTSTLEPLLSMSTLEENYNKKKISVDFENPFSDELEFLIENCRFQNSTASAEMSLCKGTRNHSLPYIFEYDQNSNFSMDCSIRLCQVNETCSQVC
ncbi:Oidioi.mRNA.OKI2018_I69.chr2.g7729.t1.cds [Oikopleura dioica]|uniref:Oidioi.mRNA.OKI2018_I69.chr2.g7729.t1.cds n=1 Tax=Oikopleura dioica TaxID=34765 RepID=A0ABN7T7P4_OIKDI|nr:Oidioi.mRNA.OKI2018_I69.chr2.g7729.t1.cds [Oikopleura dioica]